MEPSLRTGPGALRGSGNRRTEQPGVAFAELDVEPDNDPAGISYYCTEMVWARLAPIYSATRAGSLTVPCPDVRKGRWPRENMPPPRHRHRRPMLVQPQHRRFPLLLGGHQKPPSPPGSSRSTPTHSTDPHARLRRDVGATLPRLMPYPECRGRAGSRSHRLVGPKQGFVAPVAFRQYDLSGDFVGNCDSWWKFSERHDFSLGGMNPP